MSWNRRAMRAIIQKDLRQVRQNKMVWMPMIALPVILQVIMPLTMILLPRFVSPAELEMDDMAAMMSMFPTNIYDGLQALSAAQQWVVLTATYMFAPLFLIVRALALGAGLVVGFARFAGRSDAHIAPMSGLNRFLKRMMDVVGSAVGLLLTLPVMAVIGVAIKLGSKGPALFTQWRAGENGRPFKIIKFRTMVDGAEEKLDDLVDLAHLPAPAFKLHDDPRVTRVGRFLRRTSLDELPQFWNVLKGEMSLVGPRPEEVRVVQLYNDWHRQRLAVKPGMTGPMQVNGRGDMDLDDRVRLEVAYIHDYSLWQDVRILWRTVGVVLTGRGAY